MNNQRIWERALVCAEELRAIMEMNSNLQGDHATYFWQHLVPAMLVEFAKQTVKEEDRAFYRTGASK